MDSGHRRLRCQVFHSTHAGYTRSRVQSSWPPAWLCLLPAFFSSSSALPSLHLRPHYHLAPRLCNFTFSHGTLHIATSLPPRRRSSRLATMSGCCVCARGTLSTRCRNEALRRVCVHARGLVSAFLPCLNSYKEARELHLNGPNVGLHACTCPSRWFAHPCCSQLWL